MDGFLVTLVETLSAAFRLNDDDRVNFDTLVTHWSRLKILAVKFKNRLYEKPRRNC